MSTNDTFVSAPHVLNAWYVARDGQPVALPVIGYLVTETVHEPDDLDTLAVQAAVAADNGNVFRANDPEGTSLTFVGVLNKAEIPSTSRLANVQAVAKARWGA